MQRIGQTQLQSYLRADRIARLLELESRAGDRELTTQQWLTKNPAKRLVFDLLYTDLLDGERRRVLDVGGGFSALTRRLAARNDYELIDLSAHDVDGQVADFCATVPYLAFRQADWWTVKLGGEYDVVIANDLFPNVDQRLCLFLDRVLPLAREVRLSLTYYNRPKFYLAKRVDAEEILCVLAWNGAQIKAALAPYAERVHAACFDELDRTDDSIFENERQVCVVTMHGDVGRG